MTVLALMRPMGWSFARRANQSPALELVWLGGCNGQRGSRDGDIGTERVPIGEYFQLSPSSARAIRLSSRARRSRCTARLRRSWDGSRRIEAGDWGCGRLGFLRQTARPKAADRPVVIGHIPLIGKFRSASRSRAQISRSTMCRAFSTKPLLTLKASPARFDSDPRSVSRCAVGALNLAADAVWDEPQGW